MSYPFHPGPGNRSGDLDICPIPVRLSTPNDALVLPTAYGGDQQTFSFLAMRNGKGFTNIPLRDDSDGVRKALESSKAGADIYFAPAGFGSADSRKGDNVVSVRGFWLDIDCGEEKAAAGRGYATVELAWDALSRFCAEIGIPLPTHVIRSGGGLQVHWILTEPLAPAEWKATAKKLKQLTAAWGLLDDPSRTANIASLMRVPGTWNYKYDPRRLVKLIRASREFIDTATFCRLIDEAHSRYCSAPVVVETRTPVDRDQREYGPPNLAQLRTALSYLDPDCDEEIWKLERIAPLAREVPKYPELAEDLRVLAIEWSSGALRRTPSKKWREPGGNGLTGERAFPDVWDRFVHEPAREGPVFTLGTIFHAAKLAGAPLDAPPVVIPGDALSLLQGRFFLIRQGGSVWVGDREVPGQYLKRSDAGLILDRVLTARCPGVPPAPIIREFFSSPSTTEYLGIYSHPTEEREKQLNVWKGWTLRPKSGKCFLIMAFLLYVICDGDEEAFRYLLRYLAHLLQRPEEKPGVMIVLLGGQGAGKGTFGHLLHRMLGELYLHVFNLQHVFGNHNDVLERTLLIFADEVSQSQRGKIADAMKSFITETHVTVNPKNQPVRQIQSFHRLIIASNAEHVKHTDRDDRRDFVLRVSDRHQGDAEYWTALYDEIDGDGTAAFMYELLQLDISNFNVRQRPITAALREQKLQSEDDVGRWLYQCLQEGVMGGPEGDWPEFVSTEDVLGWVEDFSGGRRHRRWSRQEIVRRLTQMCPSIRKAQKAVIPGAVRRRGLELPSLEVARKEFEAYIGHPVDWED